jgi:hypothetical protein
VHAGVSTPRWMAVGRSDNPDARTAGAEAIKAALAGGNDDPSLAIVFAADHAT